jgi:hypothetical protein
MKCSKNKDGIHRIPMMPPSDVESWKKWKSMSDEEKRKAQFCIDCGEAIW